MVGFAFRRRKALTGWPAVAIAGGMAALAAARAVFSFSTGDRDWPFFGTFVLLAGFGAAVFVPRRDVRDQVLRVFPWWNAVLGGLFGGLAWAKALHPDLPWTVTPSGPWGALAASVVIVGWVPYVGWRALTGDHPLRHVPLR